MIIEDNEIYNLDCKVFMDHVPDDYYNFIYTDTPYNMGSEYTIDDKGHYRFKGKGSDFMNDWEAMDGLWWHDFFKKAYRIIKPGGFFITHNIDRQSDLWTYYARRSGFMPLQKLYWLFIDNFPKGVDVGTQLDKLLGIKRDVVGKAKGAQANSTGKYGAWGKTSIFNKGDKNHNSSEYDKTVATSSEAKKYDGYKYGQAALKQVVEEILVLWKQPEINVPKAILQNEDKSRVRHNMRWHPSIFNIQKTSVRDRRPSKPTGISSDARWTPNLLIDSRVRPGMIQEMSHEDAAKLVEILPIVKYQKDDETFLPYAYVKKPNKAEKNMGLEEAGIENIHSTVKPIALCKWVLDLFAIPDKHLMKVYDPFSGQGTIPRACKELGIPYNGTELNPEFFKIIKAKEDHINNKLTLF